MELSNQKIIAVSELKPLIDIKRRENFLSAFGKLLLKGVEKYTNSADKLSFLLLLNMVDFVVDHDLYGRVLLEIQDKSWIEKKVDELLIKLKLSEKTEDLGINELMSIGTTHYFLKNWGSPKNFSDDLCSFATTLS